MTSVMLLLLLLLLLMLLLRVPSVPVRTASVRASVGHFGRDGGFPADGDEAGLGVGHEFLRRERGRARWRHRQYRDAAAGVGLQVMIELTIWLLL